MFFMVLKKQQINFHINNMSVVKFLELLLGDNIGE